MKIQNLESFYCLKRNMKSLKRKRKKIKIANLNKQAILQINQLPTFITLANEKYRKPFLKTIDYIKLKSSNAEPCDIDFTNVRRLFPDGTIHLMHQLDKTNNINITGKSSSSPVVRSMLTKLGIHNKLKVPDYYKPHNIVDRWNVISGEGRAFDEKYIEFQDVLKLSTTDENKLLIINNAISEAIANVADHAYDDDDPYKKWFIFFAIQGNFLSIIVSDLGKSIPVTLKIKHEERILSFLDGRGWNKILDSERIELATKIGRSQTDLYYRGQGLPKIIGLQNSIYGSKVAFLSRRGAVYYEKQSDKEVIQNANFYSPIDGTIVCWQLPLTTPSFPQHMVLSQ